MQSPRSRVQTPVPPWFLNVLFIFNSWQKKKRIEILTKIHAKITITVLENREPYSFIIICKCKEGPSSLFSYEMLVSILTMDEQSSYYEVYGVVRVIQNSQEGAHAPQ